ncbi:MAG: DUF4914 family protein [Bacteroidales bacterium]
MEKMKIKLPAEAVNLIENAPSFTVFDTVEQLADAAVNGKGSNYFEVKYDVEGKGEVTEAIVHRVTNGISANYTETYMRRRDPDTMAIGDDKPTDQPLFKDRFNYPFEDLRTQTFDWMVKQDLAAFYFKIGNLEKCSYGLAIVPANAGFFAMGLAMLQRIVPLEAIPDCYDIKVAIYVAPPFRHTHFDGKQVVVHNRTDKVYEVFSYNLYPGPSAKKGIYGVILSIGEDEGWSTAHCSAVESISPYDNITRFMHEGASGGGKSEMLQHILREPNGEVLIGYNLTSNERRTLTIPQFCEIRPICDDMGMVHPSFQTGSGRIRIIDAENAWFIRTDSITEYGKDPILEKLTINTKRPFLFLNIDTNPGGTALVWNHIEDEPGKPCPNPRVVVPRRAFPNVVNEPVSIDIRSFGVRTPPCTAENPSYGIFGLFHILPPALAWLWRLVSPRGHANPSIVDKGGMQSEGVGSYWPFATGEKVNHANLLLEQIVDNTITQYVISPNQHIGNWRVGFMPQMLMREYLTRRGNSRFRSTQIQPARCTLLGYELNYLTIEGSKIPSRFLKVYKQPEIGFDGYDKGAAILMEFFKKELQQYRVEGLSDLGRQIIETCLNDGTAEDYEKLIKK